jgi:hypothetical protein
LSFGCSNVPCGLVGELHTDASLMVPVAAAEGGVVQNATRAAPIHHSTQVLYSALTTALSRFCSSLVTFKFCCDNKNVDLESILNSLAA